jgi:sec-independent protein translocase protein TatA
MKDREGLVFMGSIGTQEIIIIFIIALIVFGPRKLPELGKSIGKGLAEFKKASNELRKTWEDEVNLDKEKSSLNNAISESTGNLSGIVNEVKNDLSEIAGDMNKSVDSAVSTAMQEESPK